MAGATVGASTSSCTNLPSTLSSSSSSPASSPSSSAWSESQTKSRRAATARRSFPTVSSCLLSLLSAVTLSSIHVHASPFIPEPTPLLFLCPFAEQDDFYVGGGSGAQYCASQVPADPVPTHFLDKRVDVPDKYETGVDGSWRRADVYTLYGSTVCLSCSTATTSTVTASPTPTVDDILNSLPTGWRPTTRKTVDHSPMIVVGALVAAISIFGFMLGIIFWRKKVRKKGKEDLEMKARKKREPSEACDLIAQSKQKLWTKASARWRSSIRSAARRRKDKRLAAVIKNSQISIRLSSDSSSQHAAAVGDALRDLGDMASATAPPVSPTISEIKELADMAQDSPASPVASTVQLPVGAAPPPAYPAGTTEDGPSFLIDDAPSYELSSSSPMPAHISDSLTYIPYVPNVAHVAVDDKTVLARMHEQASAPPVDNGTIATSHGLQVSAPEWEDDAVDDCVIDDSLVAGPSYSKNAHYISPSVTNSSLPPPPVPLQRKVFSNDLVDYPGLYEVDLTDEELGFPSFAGFPSAPLVEHYDDIPSAPPLFEAEDTDDHWHQATVPSEPGTLTDPAVGAQDHDRIAVEAVTNENVNAQAGMQ